MSETRTLPGQIMPSDSPSPVENLLQPVSPSTITATAPFAAVRGHLSNKPLRRGDRKAVHSDELDRRAAEQSLAEPGEDLTLDDLRRKYELD